MKRDIDMHSTARIALLTFLLTLGIVGVGMHIGHSMWKDTVDPCYGYAIC